MTTQYAFGENGRFKAHFVAATSRRMYMMLEQAKGQPRGSLQARMSESDPRLYNVNRDVAHNFKQVMERVFSRLQHRLWPELEQMLDDRRITDAEVGRAFDCLCQFVGGAQDNMKLGFQEALAQTGWFKCKPEAQVAVMSVLGTVILGYHYAGVREATLGGDGPALTLKTLAAKGEEMAAFLALPRWKRPFAVFWSRMKRAGRLLLGRE